MPLLRPVTDADAPDVLALNERNYKGKVYQTHAAATRDLIRVGGKGSHTRATTASSKPSDSTMGR